MDNSSEKPKKHMIRLSKAAYTKVRELNKLDKEQMGRMVTMAETVERRVL